MNYDLEERTAKFGEDIIEFVKTLPRKDFKNKIHICRKEANETKHWLRMIARANKDKEDDCRRLWKEAHELTLIFAKISKSCNIKNYEI